MSLPGVDVSNNNGSIDWAAVASHGVRFAYLKVSEGTSFRDKLYEPNRQAALEHGIRVGGYHFARPDRNPPDKEADRFAHLLAAGGLPPVLDLEVAGTDLHGWASAFHDRLQMLTGRQPGLYASQSWWQAHDLGRIGWSVRWVASWSQGPSIPWEVWQTTDKGTVPGISGHVDLDTYTGTQTMLDALAGVQPAPPPTGGIMRLVRDRTDPKGHVYLVLEHGLVHVSGRDYTDLGAPKVEDLPFDDPIWSRVHLEWY